MGRVYKKKTNRIHADPENIKNAIKSIIKTKQSIRHVAISHKINYKTLFRHYQAAQKEGLDSYDPHPKLKHRQVFSVEQEKLLEIYFSTSAKLNHGFSFAEARKFALEFANHNRIPVPSSWREGVNQAGGEWLRGFLSRHSNLTRRITENVSMARIKGFTRAKVEDFFKTAEEINKKFKYNPAQIWNFDESSLSTVARAKAVIATKGVKSVGSSSSQERGTSITFAAFINAAGKALNPIYIMPRQNYVESMNTGTRDGTMIICNGSGYNTKETFVQILRGFIEETGSSLSNRQLLYMDSHESHISLEAIDMARDNGVDFLTFPPHCTHKMQPLDVSVYGPFKSYCNQALHSKLDHHINKKISIHELPGLTKIPFERAFTATNIISGFRKTGI